MSVKIEASGRRSIQVEVEVPGTPEEVWKAIATGPGVSAWFVPSEIEEREGGAVVDHFGPGMDSTATVTVWDPPRRFAAEGEGLAPGAPGMATEWTVEARAGGVCVVRVVHSLFASNDDWDNQLASVETGWPTFFRVLVLYLTHFRGQGCSSFRLMGFDPGPEAKAWDAFADALGLSGASAGQRWSAPAGVPALSGIVDHVSEAGQAPLMVLRIDEPAPGTVTLNVFNMGGMVCPYASVYLYGESAAAAVERNEPLWQAWMQQRFPAPAQAMPEA